MEHKRLPGIPTKVSNVTENLVFIYLCLAKGSIAGEITGKMHSSFVDFGENTSSCGAPIFTFSLDVQKDDASYVTFL